MAKRKKKVGSRVKPILDALIGTEDSDDIFDQLVIALSDSQEQLPRVGQVYMFQYFATTQGLLYDRFPVVGVTGVYEWGFSGANLHLKDPRNYNFNQISSPIFRISPEERAHLLALPLEYLVQNK